MSTSSEEPSNGFIELGISAPVLASLEKLKFTQPTPIQAKAIPLALTGQDLVGIAQTGTGKTMAFGLPIIDRLLAAPGQALILVPTRELALQVEESLRQITRLLNPGIRTISLIGGMPIYRQFKDLKMNPRIIVATPGRLQDHMNQKTVSLNQVKTLVLDEADRMLDMGFAPQINRILEQVPDDSQTMLFSATMAPEIVQLSSKYLKNPARIEIAKAGTSATAIEQELLYIRPTEKVSSLERLLQKHEGTVLVFTRTKHGAHKLSDQLLDMGHSAAEIHSDRSLSQRRQALDGFKAGRYRVLVATDVASRGIDVHNITLVVNYDLPDAAEDYVHRIGRTGRAGNAGRAITFATPDQQREVKSIERIMNKALAISPDSSAQPAVYKQEWTPRPSSGSGNRSGGPSSRPNQFKKKRSFNFSGKW